MEKIRVGLEFRKYGTVKLELYPQYAPLTVKNFLKLVKSNYYNDKIIHYICRGHFLRGGGNDKHLTYMPTPPIKGEYFHNGVINPISHVQGTITMARLKSPNSATSDFMILADDLSYLMDGYYAAFGRVYEGFEIISEIANSDCFVYNGSFEQFPVINCIYVIENEETETVCQTNDEYFA